MRASRFATSTAALLAFVLLHASGAGSEPADDRAGLAWALAQQTEPEALPSYQLHLDPKPLRKLMAYRERIYDRRFLSPGDREWVAASFSHEGERYPVKLRIRGDLPNHWQGSHQSYRLKFTKRLFRRQKELSLILPADKHYGIEILQTRVSEDLGVPYFPGRFVNLHINGRDAGLYFESEHPSSEYLERTGRTASSIFTFSYYWTQYFGTSYHHAVFLLPGSRDLLPLQGVGQIKQRATYGSDRPLFAKKQLAYAIELYRLLTFGTPQEIASRAGSYLALDNVAKYVAIQDFFGARHGMSLNDNIRLYLDPTSGKFEFMPWDTSLRSLAARLRAPGATLDELLTPEDKTFAVLLDAVPHLREQKDLILRRLVADGDRYRAELNRIHAGLIHLYPDDEQLRQDATSFDAEFHANVETLERYFGRVVPRSGEEPAD